MILTYTTTDAEEKALRHCMADPQEWFTNFVQQRCRIAIEDMYNEEVEELKANPATTHIPVNKEEVVLGSSKKSASQRNAEMPLPPGMGPS